MKFYDRIKPFLVALLALYVSFAAYFLKQAAPLMFNNEIVRHGFVVSLIFLAIAAWIWTAYEFYVWKSKDPLSFPDLVLELIDDLMAVDFKEALEDFAMKSYAMWKSGIEQMTDKGDKMNLILDILGTWFIGQIMVFVGMFAAYKYMTPMIGAVMCFLLVGLSAIYTILCWETGKYVWKNGKDGYKHTRRIA